MKKNKINFLALSLLSVSLFLTSCDDNDDATGYSTLEVNSGVTGTVVTDFNSTAVINVNEGDGTVFTYTVSISEAQPVDIHIRVTQIAGTASADDFKAETVVIPAYATSAVGSIEIVKDDLIEGFETLTLQIGSVSTSNAAIPFKTVSFNIANYLGDLELVFDFNETFSVTATGDGTDYSLCGIGYDMDYLVLDSAFNDMGLYGAATGACPEKLSLSLTDLPTGTYYIVYDIYDDGGLSGVPHGAFDIPTTVTVSRPGGINPTTFVQEDEFVPTSIDGGGSDYVMTIEVANGIFTIKTNDGVVQASGRNANKIKNAIQSAKAQNRNKR